MQIIKEMKNLRRYTFNCPQVVHFQVPTVKQREDITDFPLNAKPQHVIRGDNFDKGTEILRRKLLRMTNRLRGVVPWTSQIPR